MNQLLIVKNTITINAPASKVWDALTNPEQTKKYMFGCETVSDWRKGSPLLWKGNYEGKEMALVTGKHYAWSNPDSFQEKIVMHYNKNIAELKSKWPQQFEQVRFSFEE